MRGCAGSRAGCPAFPLEDQGTSIPTDVPSAAAGSPCSNASMARAKSTIPDMTYQNGADGVSRSTLIECNAAAAEKIILLQNSY
jgi:hypothetical protein